MYSIFDRDSTYGGLIKNIYNTKDLREEEKEQVKNIFILNNGFLRDEQALEKSQAISFLTIPYSREIVGYTLYSLHLDNSFLEEYDNLWAEQIIPRGIYINQVAMHPDYQNKGYAISMYMNILKEHKEINKLYAHVAISNNRSMKYHCRHKFVPIGEYICPNFHGVKNYKSILLEYCKKSYFNNF